jgi:hypothetical protein
MLFKAFLLSSFACVVTASFHLNDAVVSYGLQTDTYDCRLGVIVGDSILDKEGQSRYPVVFWMGHDKLQNRFSQRTRIKGCNLVAFNGINFFPQAVYDASNPEHVENLLLLTMY